MSEANSKTRIEARLATLNAEGRAAMVTFVTAGDPDLETSRKILLGLPDAGADIIEIGMPFSDPMADGPSIQESSRRALANGHKMADTLQLVRDFRAHDNDTPIVLMGYYNPIYVYPREAFLDDACAAGVDGLIIVDLPPEADDELCIPAGERGINFIRLATPTTDDDRLKTVVTNTSGFVYYISMTGITGDELAQSNVASVHHNVQRIRDAAGLPVAVGFGVRTTEQVRNIAAGADGVVVGSALVYVIKSNISGETINQTGAVAGIHELVRELSRGLTSGSAHPNQSIN